MKEVPGKLSLFNVEKRVRELEAQINLMISTLHCLCFAFVSLVFYVLIGMK